MDISSDKLMKFHARWIWLRKANFLRETESLLISVQNNDKKTKIDKMQKISKCMICDDRNKTINHIIGCSKLPQTEHRTRHDWVGKVICWELRKKLKFV